MFKTKAMTTLEYDNRMGSVWFFKQGIQIRSTVQYSWIGTPVDAQEKPIPKKIPSLCKAETEFHALQVCQINALIRYLSVLVCHWNRVMQSCHGRKPCTYTTIPSLSLVVSGCSRYICRYTYQYTYKMNTYVK